MSEKFQDGLNDFFVAPGDIKTFDGSSIHSSAWVLGAYKKEVASTLWAFQFDLSPSSF